jgi:hypothetical protein
MPLGPPTRTASVTDVLLITPRGYELSRPDAHLVGPGQPPRRYFADAVVIDLRPLGWDSAALAAMLLPVADPRLPQGHVRTFRGGIQRWSPDSSAPVLHAAPDVLATLARALGARVLHGV